LSNAESLPARGVPAHAALLPALMALGAAGGLGLGALLGPRWSDPALEPLVVGVELLGESFLSLLRAIAVPLVITSVTLSVAQLRKTVRFGRLAAATGAWVIGTTLIAVLTGLALVTWISPGVGMAPHAAPAAPAAVSAWRAIGDAIGSMFPSSWAGALVDSNVLGLVVASLLIGGGLARAGERASALIDLLDVVNQVLLDLVRLVVWLAPLGIFGLIAVRVAEAGGGSRAWDEVRALGGYAVTVCAGLALHAMITLAVLLALLARRAPHRFAAQVGEALITAAGTASSAATLGVTLRCVTARAGVSANIAEFMLPLGATVNMNGTALYEAVAVVFLAQVSGIELSGAALVVLALTATFAAIGAAAIPEAGLVTMVVVMAAVGLPPEGIGLILSIDWILDRARTAVNVWGDAVGAAVLDRQLRAS